MDDRQLLEAAARAAGIEVWRGTGHQSDMLFRAPSNAADGKVTGVEWNPLADDGDSFRLACDLKISVKWTISTVAASWYPEDEHKEPRADTFAGDRAAARRAIARCAAGKALASAEAGR